MRHIEQLSRRHEVRLTAATALTLGAMVAPSTEPTKTFDDTHDPQPIVRSSDSFPTFEQEIHLTFDEPHDAVPHQKHNVADPEFLETWRRNDLGVADGKATQSWTWGPAAFTPGLEEPYKESVPGPSRLVQYFDKSRMEITNFQADRESEWYVSNGLLATELITGRMQVGHDSFIELQPSQVNIAGDPDDELGPTYASFSQHVDEPATPIGTLINRQISRDGSVAVNKGFDMYNIQVSAIDEETNHSIAQPFFEFINAEQTIYDEKTGTFIQGKLSEDPNYVTGRPITEPYWTVVKIDGIPRGVLTQAFERRVLTFNPNNPPQWQVEHGNVGRHYYNWRYGENGFIPHPLNTEQGSETLIAVLPQDKSTIKEGASQRKV